jgi:hypothetical protein
MINKQFDKGREYERLRRDSSRNLWLGYGLLLYPILMIFGKHFDLTSFILLIVLGLFCLYVGYSEKKELKKFK